MYLHADVVGQKHTNWRQVCVDGLRQASHAPTCWWWPWWRGSSSGLQEERVCDLYSRVTQQSISPLICPDPRHTLQTAHACSYRHPPAGGGRMGDVPASPTADGLALQHACESPSILFILFWSQAWTHCSSVHPSYFMSGWARKTEGNMRLLIATLTPGWHPAAV